MEFNIPHCSLHFTLKDLNDSTTLMLEIIHNVQFNSRSIKLNKCLQQGLFLVVQLISDVILLCWVLSLEILKTQISNLPLQCNADVNKCKIVTYSIVKKSCMTTMLAIIYFIAEMALEKIDNVTNWLLDRIQYYQGVRFSIRT